MKHSMHVYFRLRTAHCLCKNHGLALGLVGLVLGLGLMLELELVVAAACLPLYDTRRCFNVRSKAFYFLVFFPVFTLF